MSILDSMKKILREDSVPFFSAEDLQFYLDQNNGNMSDALYQCLIIKSEDTTLNVSGLSLGDSSTYFKRLASRYKPRHSGSLKGGY